MGLFVILQCIVRGLLGTLPPIETEDLCNGRFMVPKRSICLFLQCPLEA